MQPLSGPTYAGTRVTIDGGNLGQSFDEIANRVNIGNVSCRPVESEYRVSNRIVCITNPVVSNRFAAVGSGATTKSSQYHPNLVDQIANASPNAQQQLTTTLRTDEVFPSYVSRESDTFLHRLGQYLLTALMFVLYSAIALLLLIFVYSSLILTHRFKQKNKMRHEYRRIQSKIDSLEKSVRGECRIASMALQSELNELIRHIELSGCPIFPLKQYIMKVFFPGIHNHPLATSKPSNVATTTSIQMDPASNLSIGQPLVQPIQMQSQLERPLMGAADESPMDQFERLILNKSFLITFVNTLERQPSFTIRDKVNVASLLMICLMNDLDYAIDVLRTLLFQLVERSVNRNQLMFDRIESSRPSSMQNPVSSNCRSQSSLTERGLKFLKSLPIYKSNFSRTSNLSKVVSGSANSLMASTQVAAQMLLSRVGGKPSAGILAQQIPQATSPMGDQNNMAFNGKLGHCMMSTTTFNHRNTLIHTIGSRTRANRSSAPLRGRRDFERSSSLAQLDVTSSQVSSQVSSGISSQYPDNSDLINRPNSSSIHLMLRRTESVVEKMLTNWLAMNMYDYFYGEVGHSLYMMFEGLKHQLERGPIDSVSGDAYYTLNEAKLLREPHIQFKVVNLYVIVDTDILRPNHSQVQSMSIPNPNQRHAAESIYEDPMRVVSQAASSNEYSTNNTITLTLRVLDCDTINQVKGKILNALYRNSPSSSRLTVDDVELSMRQQQPDIGGSHFNTIELQDEDYSTVVAFNGVKRVNTLRHYGIVDQAIMMLNRNRRLRPVEFQSQPMARGNLNMLEEHYNNPYSEIQYMPVEQHQHNSNSASNLKRNGGQLWHLTRSEQADHSMLPLGVAYGHMHLNDQSEDSSPASNSPSMMLLGSENLAPIHGMRTLNGQNHDHSRQPAHYHPSSSSSSSMGNGTLDAINPASVHVTNNLLRVRNGGSQQQQQQPIYCQIGSVSARSQHDSGYYCQINPQQSGAHLNDHQAELKNRIQREQEQNVYLARMLASKGTVQSYIDNFFKTILSAKPCEAGDFSDNKFSSVLCADLTGTSRRNASSTHGACPPAVKWLFDLLEEAAMENGVSDPSVIHSWKSNAFLFRFWVNLIKNPHYILDVEKSATLDSTLSVVAQTLMDSCSANDNDLAKVSLEKTNSIFEQSE